MLLLIHSEWYSHQLSLTSLVMRYHIFAFVCTCLCAFVRPVSCSGPKVPAEKKSPLMTLWVPQMA